MHTKNYLHMHGLMTTLFLVGSFAYNVYMSKLIRLYTIIAIGMFFPFQILRCVNIYCSWGVHY